MLRRLPLISILLTLGLLAARVVSAPPLLDPTGASLPPSVRLQVPALHVILAPLFDLWDGVSLLSLSRLQGFVAGLGLGFLAWRVFAATRRRRRDPDAGPPIPLVREAGVAIAVLALFAVFVAGGMLWHRPMVAIAGVPEGMIVVDFHAHTNASHDVTGTLMNGFDAEATREWHARAGFDAAFVTDHNTVAGFPKEWASAGSTLLCPGVEVSGWHAHTVLLEAREAPDRAAYGGSLEGILRLIRDSGNRYHALAIASLPEYDRNHWSNLAAMVEAGLAGFEIVNGSPKAREFSRARRDSVIGLAHRHDLLLLAVTDAHGWGATAPGWNLVRVSGWSTSDESGCRAIRQALERGSESVQIAERHHLRAESAWPWILTPVGVLWETWRSLGALQLLSWLLWIWLIGLVSAYRRTS